MQTDMPLVLHHYGRVSYALFWSLRPGIPEGRRLIIDRESNMGFNITLKTDNLNFVAEAGETILEAAKRHGILLPQGCGDGACGLCKGTVLQGTVDHGKATVIALTAGEREEGLALFCCAKPKSDLVIERCRWEMMDWSSPMD